jgi:very-short-patch-repair endonuclease
VLRRFKQHGFHFRQQARVGPYIADLVCRSAKLIIELDGAHHSESEQMRYDEARTAYLSARGYRVLRFNNVDVLKHREEVVDAVLRAMTPTRKIAPRFFDLPARGR